MTRGNAAARTELGNMPVWVPQIVVHYLAHTEAGVPIRDLARRAECHASTILRQIRRMETRRDDPLIDHMLTQLARATETGAPIVSDAALQDEARRVLRRLCEQGAVLAVADDMDKAVVVREGETGAGLRTAVIDRDIAAALALADWIGGAGSGRIRRYGITAAGRSVLNQWLAQAENAARIEADAGFAEGQAGFDGKSVSEAISEGREGRARRMRYGTTESPLSALARRRDRDGQPFLSEDLVRAGERLREDFELSQLGPRVAQDWDRYLTAGVDAGPTLAVVPGGGPSSARDRVKRALGDLGPGLSDVALRCCCLLEGLETAEQRMGWSARSGKIVLRIALQRLKRHYDGPTAPDPMIG